MNDKAEVYGQRCGALIKTGIKAVLEYAASDDEICSEKNAVSFMCWQKRLSALALNVVQPI